MDLCRMHPSLLQLALNSYFGCVDDVNKMHLHLRAEQGLLDVRQWYMTSITAFLDSGDATDSGYSANYDMLQTCLWEFASLVEMPTTYVRPFLNLFFSIPNPH